MYLYDGICFCSLPFFFRRVVLAQAPIPSLERADSVLYVTISTEWHRFSRTVWTSVGYIPQISVLAMTNFIARGC